MIIYCYISVNQECFHFDTKKIVPDIFAFTASLRSNSLESQEEPLKNVFKNQFLS